MFFSQNRLVSPYPRFRFPRFQSLAVNHCPKILNAKPQKQTVRVLNHVILSRAVKSHAFPLHPTQGMSHPVVLRSHTVDAPQPFEVLSVIGLAVEALHAEPVLR